MECGKKGEAYVVYLPVALTASVPGLAAMLGEHPLLSIVVPAYNRAHLLPRLFESLLRQSDPQFELIVVDDGSTDRTSRLIEEFRSLFGDRLICVRHPHNRGCNAARNTGVRAARTPWCFFLDSDWELLPDSVHHAIHHTNVPPNVGAVAFLGLSLPGNVIHGYRAYDRTWETTPIPFEDVVLGRNLTGGIFAIRRRVFSDDAVWFPEWVSGLEGLFGARLARRWQFVAVREILGIDHFDPSEEHISIGFRRKWPNEFRKAYELFIAENYDVLRHHPTQYRHLALCVMRCHLYSGSYWTAAIWGVRAVYWKLYLILRLLLPEQLFGRGIHRNIADSSVADVGKRPPSDPSAGRVNS